MQEVKELVKKMKEGEVEPYFSSFYDLTKSKVYYAGKAFLKEEELLADCLQETYIDFLMQLSSIREDDEPVSYLCQIMRNKARNLYKKREREVYLDKEQEALYGEQVDGSSQNIFEEIAPWVKPKEYEIILLHFLEGMTFQEIAHHLSCPLGTVLWRYHQAIKKIQERMGKSWRKNK